MNSKWKLNKKSAMTLAEVLITLGIIGVVAAMVIPAVMNKTQDMELKNAWKKNFSVVSQAITSIISDNGGNLRGLCVTDVDGTCMFQLLSNKISTIRTCTSGTAQGNCWHQNNVAKNFGGGTDWLTTYSLTKTGLVLKDGTLMTMWWPDGNCNSNGLSSETNACGWLVIDVNGFKQPNTQGKDIFLLTIHDTWVSAEGTSGDHMYVLSGHGCTTSDLGSTSGFGCSALYLMNN